MKVIVAGTRKGIPEGIVTAALNASWLLQVAPREIVTGGASGVDAVGKAYAFRHSIPHREFPADWDGEGKAAGPRRNERMAEYADALILVWNGESRGSADMKRRAKAHGLPIFEVIVKLEGDGA